jgi:hypothetical protein
MYDGKVAAGSELDERAVTEVMGAIVPVEKRANPYYFSGIDVVR